MHQNQSDPHQPQISLPESLQEERRKLEAEIMRYSTASNSEAALHLTGLARDLRLLEQSPQEFIAAQAAETLLKLFSFNSFDFPANTLLEAVAFDALATSKGRIIVNQLAEIAKQEDEFECLRFCRAFSRRKTREDYLFEVLRTDIDPDLRADIPKLLSKSSKAGLMLVDLLESNPFEASRYQLAIAEGLQFNENVTREVRSLIDRGQINAQVYLRALKGHGNAQDLLIKHLDSESPELRCEAAESLHPFHPERAVETLEQLAKRSNVPMSIATRATDFLFQTLPRNSDEELVPIENNGFIAWIAKFKPLDAQGITIEQLDREGAIRFLLSICFDKAILDAVRSESADYLVKQDGISPALAKFAAEQGLPMDPTIRG